jgi:hypothetical protein
LIAVARSPGIEPLQAGHELEVLLLLHEQDCLFTSGIGESDQGRFLLEILSFDSPTFLEVGECLTLKLARGLVLLLFGAKECNRAAGLFGRNGLVVEALNPAPSAPS